MRLIDADKLNARLSRDATPYYTAPDIETAPTVDAVPVVRCRDCKYHHWEQEPCHGRTEHYCAIGRMTAVTRDSFCSCGVRKDGGTQS